MGAERSGAERAARGKGAGPGWGGCAAPERWGPRGSGACPRCSGLPSAFCRGRSAAGPLPAKFRCGGAVSRPLPARPRPPRRRFPAAGRAGSPPGALRAFRTRGLSGRLSRSEPSSSPGRAADPIHEEPGTLRGPAWLRHVF